MRWQWWRNRKRDVYGALVLRGLFVKRIESFRIFTRSARDSACIFPMARLRCTFTAFFRGSNLSRNLLVEHAGDNHRDHPAFSCGERFVALPRSRNF